MESMNQLKDLLKHELNDLYSAEEQIIEALPEMIEKAKDKQLKKSLRDHLKVTETQKKRLDQVLKKLGDGSEEDSENRRKSNGFLSGLFSGKQVCKGVEGLIKEGKKVMSEDMEHDVMDAAIIASTQKIEHYEIAAYGTVRAWAEQIGLRDVEKLLRTTLEEEYEADTVLNELALGRLNIEALHSGDTKQNEKRIAAGGRNQSNSSGTKKATGTNADKKKSGTRTRSRARAKA